MIKTWTQKEVEFLKKNYPNKGKMWCANNLNRTEGSIREKANTLGLRLDIESKFFKEFQNRAAQSKVGKKRPEQAKVMNRLHKEGKLKQTKKQRMETGKKVSNYFKENGHPKGMLGKKHSDKTKRKFSIDRKGKKKNLSEEQKQIYSDRASKMMYERWMNNGTTYSRANSGWYKIKNRKYYFRSGWEVNYARYLEFLKDKKEIKKWEYEVDIFWFNEIKRGVRSYKPDFKIYKNNGEIEYHEVKGYMDAKSKTKIKRMAIYYPDIKLIIIQKLEYDSIIKWEKLFPNAKKLS